MEFPFDTKLVMEGPTRTPKQMLDTQSYDNHLSIHDDKTAQSLGFGCAPIDFPVKGPVVGLFANQEIRLHDGPLFVGEPYQLKREIIAISESSKTGSYWEKVSVLDSRGEIKATTILNHALLKASYTGE